MPLEIIASMIFFITILILIGIMRHKDNMKRYAEKKDSI